jgi:hypothetical protein
VAPLATVFTLYQGPAVLNIVVISSTPGAKQSVVVGLIGPGVIVVVVGVGDLIVSHLLNGWGAVDNMRGDAVVGIGLGQGLSTFKALNGGVG